MKALTLTEPWATLVALGEKRIETRSWSTNYRGPLAIHSGKGYPKWAKDLIVTSPFRESLNGWGWARPFHHGKIIAITSLCDVQPTQNILPDISDQEWAFGDYARGRYAWVLGETTFLSFPIECRGALGLWTPPPELEQAIIEGLKASNDAHGVMAAPGRYDR